jgi:hypothetical protein
MKIFLIVIILLNAHLVFAQTPERLFESGFESATTITQGGTAWSYITSVDASTGDNWVDDFIAAPIKVSGSGSGAVIESTVDGTWGTNSIIELTADPEDAGNQVLHHSHVLANSGGGSSSRANTFIHYNYTSGPYFDEAYIKYKIYLGEGVEALEGLGSQVDWFMLSELWVHDPTNYYQAFRLNFNINFANTGGHFYWYVLAQDYRQDLGAAVLAGVEWDETNTSVAVPMQEWFTVEMYVKKGDSGNGKLKIWITPDGGSRTQIFDITALTEDPDTSSYPIVEWHMLKMYNDGNDVARAVSNGTPIEIYYDDFEYWNTIPGTIPPRPPENLHVKEN